MKKDKKLSKLTLNRDSVRRLDPGQLSGARGANGPKPPQVSIDLCTVALDGCA
jgi:hypothetical protein